MKKEKNNLHPRNKHRQGYDFEQLVKSNPGLNDYVKIINDNQTIDFSNPLAVLELNKALLVHHYGIDYWDLPSGYLCPAVPGRADYIHHTADLFDNHKNLNCLDIGTGANCIYPIIATKEYNWTVVASEIDKKAFKVAQAIIGFNPILKKKVSIRFQNNSNHILHSIIQPEDYFDLVICNPPFYKSESEAQKKTLDKNRNLNIDGNITQRNFSGMVHELVYEGGEVGFVSKMITESMTFKNQVQWFTTLISQKDSLKPLDKLLLKAGVHDKKIIHMSQGSKSSRILVWKY